jgi:pullulanase
MTFESSAFHRRFYYKGNDLGVTRSASKTRFRLWAPSADEVHIALYKQGLGGAPIGLWSMKRSAQGTWVCAIDGDWAGHYYTYRIRRGEQMHEVVDPYAKGVGANGLRGMIVDLAKTNPPGWSRDRKPPFKKPTDAVIYELHVRDATIHPSSGARHPGKFLGLAERGLPYGAGLDHLRELGITHVHLLPVFDFASVDETQPNRRQYNWGYDPLNYNAPEGSYSTDPSDGAVRIREFKQLVLALHRAGIRVVMDVVYNHTYDGGESYFHKIEPGYYHRQNDAGEFSNGSGCGNEIASERPMVRKMIVDSLVYWAREYHIDGFRFDLMGLHDLETMREIRRALDRVDASILLYGEGWTGGDSPLPWKKRAMKTNVRALDRIAAFNDTIRDAIKGPVMEHSKGGFVQGVAGLEEAIKAGVVAQTKHPQVSYPNGDDWRGPWAEEPWRCVSYDSCHDNHTLWDKLALTASDDPERVRLRMNKLAAAIVLTSQGIPFLHAGEEFARTKKGVENSYNKPDAINAIDWRRKKKYADLVAYYRGLIAIRKSMAEFRLASADEIRKRLTFLPGAPAGVVAFLIAGPRRNVVVVYNSRRSALTMHLPEARWSVLVDEARASVRPLRRHTGGAVEIAPLSAFVART